MPYSFPVDAEELIAERARQWIAQGVGPDEIDRVRTRVSDVWSEAPGGWVNEWSALAEQAEEDGDPLRAARLYGVAKFPVLGNAAHAKAYENQLRTFLESSRGFEVGFERHEIEVPFRGAVVRVPVHLYLPAGVPDDAPLVLALGGVDTWKVEMHGIAVAAARILGARVATVDMAGTGESPTANGADGDIYLTGVIGWMRRSFPQAANVGAVGFSFGAHWTSKLALTRQVDAAVNVGAPIDETFSSEQVGRMRFGMAGIFGNTLGLAAAPSTDELAELMAPFSLRRQGLLDDWGANPAPLLVVNGDQDQHVPLVDTTLFESRPNTVVRVVPGASHCAAEALGEVIPWMLGWLRDQLR